MTAALVAFFVTFVLLPGVILWLRRRYRLDVPNERSSHSVPTPRGAGIAVAGGAVAGLIVFAEMSTPAKTGLLAGAVSFGAIGLADDVFAVPARVRLGLQVVAGALALPGLLHGLSGSPVWQVAFVVGSCLWLISFVNAFNFMDGINGISCSQVIIAGLAWVVVAHVRAAPNLRAPAVVIVAACVALVPFNFPRAFVFLGDVGSYFLGAWLAAAAIVGLRASIPPEAILAPLSLYLADTSLTILRRATAGEVWHEAHRSHVYQRLARLGWSHAKTTGAVTAVMVVCSGLGMVSLSGSFAARAVADLAIVAVLGLYLRAPGLLRRPSATTGSINA